MYRLSFDEGFLSLLEKIWDQNPTLLKIERIDPDSIDMYNFREEFIKSSNVADTSADANANVELRTISTLGSEKTKPLSKIDSLDFLYRKMKDMYGSDVAQDYMYRILTKEINVQDVVEIEKPYCWAFDTFDLLHIGLPFIRNYPSEPAKHSDTFLQHAIQLVQFAASQLVGATAIPNVLITYAHLLKQDSCDPDYPVPHWKHEPELFKRYVEQRFQEFVFSLNQPLRQNQSCFTNITIFDRPFLSQLCDMYGVDTEFAMMVQEMFLETFNKLCRKHVTTFPIVTVQLKTAQGQIEDIETFEKVVDYNLEFGHINIFSAEELTALSSCCRLISDVSDIIKAKSSEHQNLIGGSSLKVGSSGVCTVNLPRISLDIRATHEIENLDTESKLALFLRVLRERAEIAYRVNHTRRKIIEERIAQGLMPLYTHNLITLKNQYSTLGFVGLYEAVELLDIDPMSTDGEIAYREILKAMEEESNNAIVRYGYRCNVEQIPGESTAIRFTDADRSIYHDLPYRLYSNQFIPLSSDVLLTDRVARQAQCERNCTGGSILHISVEQRLSRDAMRRILSYVIRKGVRYFAINFFIAQCVNKHYSTGRSELCPVCGQQIAERFTRIVGFLRPVSSWHARRREEFFTRHAVSDTEIASAENNMEIVSEVGKEAMVNSLAASLSSSELANYNCH